MVKKQTTLDGTLEQGVRKLLNENIISPPNGNSERTISQFEIGNIDIFVDEFSKQITGENLLSVFINICTSYDCGFKLTSNDNPNEMRFSLYQGRDMS